MERVAKGMESLSAPKYTGLELEILRSRNPNGECYLGLAVESMRRHMTDEGWQIFNGLKNAGYTIAGHDLPVNETNVERLIQIYNPTTVVLQDKREWDVSPGNFRDPRARFTHLESLKKREDIFKLTILKDAHQQIHYHKESAEEIDCHAWIVYYLPAIVQKLAPYVRKEHLIRTYHTIDSSLIPRFNSYQRRGALLSGAVSTAYPLRERLLRKVELLPETILLRHPGYHRSGCETPNYLQQLSRYKVAICTASIYGYALRKIIEATACGCRVVTDLPIEDMLPEIDDNLIRIPSSASAEDVGSLLPALYDSYDEERQKDFAARAKIYYDYRVMGKRLAADIELARIAYPFTSQSAEGKQKLVQYAETMSLCYARGEV